MANPYYARVTYDETNYLPLLDCKPCDMFLYGSDVSQYGFYPSDLDNVGLGVCCRKDIEGVPLLVDPARLACASVCCTTAMRDELRVTKERVRALESSLEGLHKQIDKLLGWGSWS